MKRCSVCKTTYDDNFEYCPKCGRRIYPFEEETKLVIIIMASYLQLFLLATQSVLLIGTI